MLSISSNSMSRSSLEQMLDLLQRRDENEKPKDLPPELPVRPKLASRARLPSAKRPLTTVIEGGEAEPHSSPSDCHVKKKDLKGFKRNEPNSFMAKNVRGMDAGESPYVMFSAEKEEHESRLEDKDTAKLVDSYPGSLLGFRDFLGNDSVEHIMKQDWPKEKMLVQILDDADVQSLIKAEVQKWQQRGVHIIYRHLKESGANIC